VPGLAAEQRAPGVASVPREAEPARRRDIVIDLQQPPQPVARPRPSPPTPAPTRPPTPPPNDELSASSNLLGYFTESLRRRLFIVLLALALLGGAASVYNFARNNLSGFGAPRQIEVTANAVNVLTRPSARATKLGEIPNGSRHLVLTKKDDGWLQIEVSHWSKMEPNAGEQNRGWVDGNSGNVRVVSRQWW
jgi:hypothetical protein